MISGSEDRILYILRMATWHGWCARRSIVDRFEVSTTLASSDLRRALARFPSHLRRGKGGVVKIGVAVHPLASATVILGLALSGAAHLNSFGVDLPVLPDLPVDVPSQMSMPSDRLNPILMSLIHGVPVWINYVSLRPGDLGKWRLVHPVRFEVKGGQIRLCAVDLGGGEELVDPNVTSPKFFVLSRILDAREDRATGRIPMIRHVEPGMVTLRVRFNDLLTGPQKTVLSREIGISAGMTVTLRAEDVFEFSRRWHDSLIDDQRRNVVWPVLSDVERVS